jgi:hypothetical protein
MAHFLAAVRLNDRWHAADASFTRPILQHFEACFPVINGLHRERLGLGRPFHPAARFSGRDPFDIAVLNSLGHAMASRSSHDIDRLEVMNLVVDWLQGPVFDAPRQVLQARRLLNADPTMAFQLALSVAVSRAHELRNRILEPALEGVGRRSCPPALHAEGRSRGAPEPSRVACGRPLLALRRLGDSPRSKE